MAPRSDGNWPAGRLFIEIGAINLSDFLAGRKVRLELCCKQRNPFANRRARGKRGFPFFFRSDMEAGRWSFTTCLVSKKSSPKFILQLFVNLEPVPYLGVAKELSHTKQCASAKEAASGSSCRPVISSQINRHWT